MLSDLREVVGHFAVRGEVLTVVPFSGGHIHDSYLVTARHGAGTSRYLMQRLNDKVFRDPALVVENIQRVTAHIARRWRPRGAAERDRRVLGLVPTSEGTAVHRDSAGSWWRLYWYVDDTRVFQRVQSAEVAEQAGRAFGEFQALLADYDGPRLHETIPDFHNTPLRFVALEQAVRTDTHERVAAARQEIGFARARRTVAELLQDAPLPERIVHNDAKVNNVLFDVETGEAVCVIDLDTVMPGPVCYDFGDMVRSMTCPAAEDETDLRKVELNLDLLAAMARGYFSAARGFLTAAERAQLVTAGKVITLEQGVRFLTDFLTGDSYYKTDRPRHNLERCRTQFKLLESIERQEAQVEALLKAI